MVQDFLSMMSAIFGFLNLDMNVYGFTFSFWDVILWSLVVGVIFWFIGRLFSSGD